MPAEDGTLYTTETLPVGADNIAVTYNGTAEYAAQFGRADTDGELVGTGIVTPRPVTRRREPLPYLELQIPRTMRTAWPRPAHWAALDHLAQLLRFAAD